MLDHAMVQTCELVEMSVDKFGDLVAQSISNEPCKFRFINSLTAADHRESIQSDAMVWFKPTAAVEEGKVFRIDGEFYRITRLTKARRLANSTVLFLKGLCEKYHSVDVS
jgi:hypothetical protein